MPTAQAAPDNTNIDTTGALPGTTDALMVADTTSNDDSHVVSAQAELVATVVADDALPGTIGNTSPAVEILPGTSEQVETPSDDVVSETSLPGTSDAIKDDTTPVPSEEVLPGTLPAAKRDDAEEVDAAEGIVVSEAPQPGTSDANSRDDEDADVVDDAAPTVTEPSVAAAQVEVVPSGVDESGVSQQGGTDTTATGDSVASQQYTEQQQYTEPSGASVVTDDQSATGQTAQQDTPVAVEVTPTTTNATGASETAPTVVTQQEAVSPQATTATQDTTATAPTVADAGTAPAAGEMAGNTNSAAPSEG